MLIGHEKNIKDLQKLAKSENLAQSYLFFGPSMTGKKTAAISFAKFLEKGILEIPPKEEVLQDAKLIDVAFMKKLSDTTKDSIGIAAAHEVKNFLWQRPAVSSRRTLIIDEAEMLTTEAQNALLKVTEEPPPGSLLIFITSDPDSILPTILSRIQMIYFGPVNEKDIAIWLEKEQKVSAVKADEIAVRSFGKPGLAWRLLFDEGFQKDLALAEKYLKTTVGNRRDFIKDLIAPDDFSMRQFLAAVVLQLAWQAKSVAAMGLWHRAVSLIDSATNFGLNPRLQLENLLR